MKKRLLSVIIGLICVGVSFMLVNRVERKTQPLSKSMKRVAICQIVAHPALDTTYLGIADCCQDYGYIPGENMEIIYDVAQGDPLLAAQIAKKFVQLKPDVIIALGTVMAQAVKNAAANTGIPIVFSSITDPIQAQLVDNLQKPGSNITGVSNWIDMEPQVEKIKQMLPGLKRIGFLYNPTESNSRTLLRTLQEKAEPMGIEVVTTTAARPSEVGQAARALVKKVDAIFISNDSTALCAFESIANAAQLAKKPLFVSDTDILQRGAVAAIGPNQYTIGWQTGEMAIQILEGTSPGDISVKFPERIEFHLNQDTLAGIRLLVPEDIWEQADYIFSQEILVQRS